MCCILHNICINIEDEPFDILEMENRNNNNYAVMAADEKRVSNIKNKSSLTYKNLKTISEFINL